MSGVELLNEREWTRAIKTEFAALELTSEEEVADLARDMAQRMRDGAPVMDADERKARQGSEYGREHVRRTPGRKTIRFNRGRDAEGFYCDVGANKSAFYLAFHEWGTSKMAARPWMRPAIEAAIAAWGSKGTV